MLDLSDIIALLAIIVTIAISAYSRERNDNIRFTDAFNKVYARTFSLRKEISKLTNDICLIDFYYELDTINNIPIVQEHILDYLTELENFFNLVAWHLMTTYTLKKLVSRAFYQRIVILYTYVIYIKSQSGNSPMFQNYCKAVKKMHKQKKTKTQLEKITNICYVGIRESDTFFSNDFFNQSVCLFSSDPQSEPFSVRMNQNIDNKEMLPFYASKLEYIHERHPHYRFMFYNQRTAYNYSDIILKNSICVNSKEILTLLNNKLTMRKWLAERNIPIVPYETFLGKDILLSTLSAHFADADAFVIQQIYGGGGVGTYCTESTSLLSISKKLIPLQNYIVMPFVNNISVNTHVFIAEKQTVLSPGSIQLIEEEKHQLCYYGCDYILYRSLSDQVKEKIKHLSLYIADCLRREGYRGVAGIDFIIDSNMQVFCAEVNSRFQASSLLLDCYFTEKRKSLDKLEANSCFELNKMAFSGSIITTLNYETEINFSCYYYYCNNFNPQYYIEKSKLLQSSGARVFLDGMEHYVNQNKINENSYMFRAIFPHAISKISPDMKLWINDNIRMVSKPTTQEQLKVFLLNQGIRMEGDFTSIKSGVYESIDITLKANDLWPQNMPVNCAYNINLSQYSPYKIAALKNTWHLYYFNEELAEVIPEKDLLQSFSSYEKKILYIATDRLRIKLISGCENKNMGKGCKFCNLPLSQYSFTLQEISDALNHLKESQIPFRHILIGGGSCLSPDSWEKIIEICRKLKNDSYFCEKPISIMTMPPPIDVLPQLKEAGVEEVAFNLEIADEHLASYLMPGKHNQGKTPYYETFRVAVQIFGIGNVRSALLVGLDKEKDLYNEIITLADMGVIPCLSAFRALPGSAFEGEIGPSNEYLLKVYQNAVYILKNQERDIQELGPRCPACCNNMLIF